MQNDKRRTKLNLTSSPHIIVVLFFLKLTAKSQDDFLYQVKENNKIRSVACCAGDAEIIPISKPALGFQASSQ